VILLLNKVVVITGGSRGIGADTCRVFAKAGYYVAINYFKNNIKVKKLSNYIEKNGGFCDIFYADITKEDDVDCMFEDVKKKFGAIDVLINNAGICLQKLLIDTTLKDWQNIFNVNITGMFLCCKKILPEMIRRKRGKIINISSIWGKVGASMEVAYSASKAAVIGFSKALAKEVAPSGINVNCIVPGVIDTDMISGLGEKEIEYLKDNIPLGYIGSPKNIADAALFLADEKSSYITGEVLNVSGGFYL